MVKFAWSWKDYEREKRREERKVSRAAPSVETADPVDDEDGDAITFESQLQYCNACGKRRMQRCDFGGCPLL